MATGFEHYETPILLTTYRNLLKKLDDIAEILEADKRNGTTKFTDNPDTKGGCPPSQSGVISLWLLQSVATVLLQRGVPLPRSKEK